MASASKNWTGPNSWVSARLVVTAVANTLENYSDVTATLYGARNDGGTSYNASSSNFWININGTRTVRTSGCTVSGTGWTQVHSQTTRVYHNDDGSKTITVSAGGGITDTTFQMGSNSLNLTLDKIARKSSLNILDGVLGTALEITINRQNENFTDTITYKCGDVSGVICENTSDDSITWTPPIELTEQNTTGTNVSIAFTVETFNDTVSLGTNTKTITCAIPDTVVPTASISVSDLNGYYSKFSKYVQGKSALDVAITASGAYGSTIASYSTTVDGKAYTSAEFETEVLTTSGTLSLVVTVKDSRGRTTTLEESLSVYAYETPKLSNVSAKRCDSSGASNSSGSYLAVTFNAEITSLDSKNSAVYTVQYKKTSETSYTTKTVTAYAGKYSVSGGSYVFEADASSSYDIILTVADYFNSVQKETNGGTTGKVFSILAKGLGWAFGKVAELEDFLEVEFNAKFNKDVQLTQINGVQLLDLLHPVGSIYMSKDSTEPSVLFGGGAWERIKGRTFVGVDEEDEDFKEVGLELGEKTHTLTKAEVPNATGSLQMHGAGSGGTNMQTTTGVFTSGLAVNGYSYYANAGAWSVGMVKFDLGFGDGAHNNIQPSYTVYAWVRTA